MTDEHAPEITEVQAALEELTTDPSENRLRAAVRLLTGFRDAQLDELMGFQDDPTPPLCAAQDRAAISRVFEFALILRQAGLMPPDEDEYFERPWKWQPEYEAWLSAGYPACPDGLVPINQRTLARMRWERFVANAEAAARR